MEGRIGVSMVSIREEHEFWLTLLVRHCDYILASLAPHEKAWQATARQYRFRFNHLLNSLPFIGNSDQLMKAAQEIFPIAYRFYLFQYQFEILKRMQKISLNKNVSPFNNMLLENNEYIRLLSFYVKC